MTEIKRLRSQIDPWKELKSAAEDMETLYELGVESGDDSVEPELKSLYEGLLLERDSNLEDL